MSGLMCRKKIARFYILFSSCSRFLALTNVCVIIFPIWMSVKDNWRSFYTALHVLNSLNGFWGLLDSFNKPGKERSRLWTIVFKLSWNHNVMNKYEYLIFLFRSLFFSSFPLLNCCSMLCSYYLKDPSNSRVCDLCITKLQNTLFLH